MPKRLKDISTTATIDPVEMTDDQFDGQELVVGEFKILEGDTGNDYAWLRVRLADAKEVAQDNPYPYFLTTGAFMLMDLLRGVDESALPFNVKLTAKRNNNGQVRYWKVE